MESSLLCDNIDKSQYYKILKSIIKQVSSPLNIIKQIINKSNIKSNDLLQNTNISISGLQKEIEDDKKVILRF